MGTSMRTGIIGTGRIAKRFVPEARIIDGIEIVAVYNPHIESARRFAEEQEIHFYTDDLRVFEEKVEAVYIASPHQTHYEYTREMLGRGRHVLCEKPLCLKKSEAEELFRMAREKNLMLMEAVKTSCCPGFTELIRMAKSGVIGEVKDVEACFTRLTPRNTREFTDTAYGGSFTEFGSYVLLPVIRLLGTEYTDICFKSLQDENGVDWYTRGFLDYGSQMASVKTGLSVKSEGQLLISGTEGYILAESPWWLTKKFEVRYEDPNKRETYTFPFEGQGLRYEIGAFCRLIEGKRDHWADDKTGEERGDGADCGQNGEIGLTPEESVAMAEIMEKFLEERAKYTEKEIETN